MLDFLNADRKIEQKNDIVNNYTSCIYCGIRTSDMLVQCGQCDHKFCNGFSDSIQSSHIIFHIGKSKHKTIKLAKKNFNESLYSDDDTMEIVSCGYCSVSDIFNLYFFKDTENKKIEFLCQFHYEKKMKESKDYQEKKFFEYNFKKIVSQEKGKKRSFIDPMIVEIPNSLEDINLLADCDLGVIYKNEELLESVDPITQRFLNKVKEGYSSDEDYYDIYKPLIFSELNYVRQIYLKKQEYPIELELDKERDELFIIINNSFKDINLNIGKRVNFSQEPKVIEEMFNKNEDDDDDDYNDQSGFPIEFLGLVNQIIPSEDNKKIIILPVDKDISKIRNNLGKYYMRENFCQVPYFRMLKGLDSFVNNSRYNTSNLVHSQILGITDQDNIKELDEMEMKNIFNDNELITKIDNYGELNTQQRKCLEKVFEHSLNMIQGPPGTGKTLLASFIIYNIFRKRKDDQDKILVCAPSNSAADNLAIYLLKIINSIEKNDKDKDKGNLNNIQDNKESKSNNNKRMKILRVYPKIRELLNIINNNELTEISLHKILEDEIEKYKLKKFNENNEEEEENEEKIEEKELNNLIKFLPDNTSIENNLKNEKVKEDPKNNKGKSAELEERKILPKKLKNIIRNIIDEYDIVISTCSTSFDNKLINMDFKYVIIDESTQCNEVECLLPIVHGSNHVVLIGDQKQLGPTVLYPKAKMLGMKVSLFERMIRIHPENFMALKKQYRMNEELSKFPSDFFYDEKIKSSSKHKESENKYIKRIFKKFCWPKKDIPIMFININNKTTSKYNLNINNKKNEEKEEENYFTFERDMGKSYENELEAKITVKLINMFNDIKSYKKGKYDIGIITPYIGQKKLILEKLYLKDKDFDYYNNNIVTVASVDSFQGKEKDFIIINTVRSNYKNFIGFLKDPRRLNVSLTRAKHGLIIIGDAYCLSKSIGENGNKYSVWRYLLQYYQDIGVIVDYNDGEKGEKMFTPTKIFKDEILEKYNFQEYDYDTKNNKPNINRDYIDNYEYCNRYQHYIDEREIGIDDDFLDDNDFQYDDYYEDIIEEKNLNYNNYDNKYYYKDNFNYDYDYYNKYSRDEMSTNDDYYNINDYNINNAYNENLYNNNYYYYNHSNIPNNYESYDYNNYDNNFYNYRRDF